MQDSKLVSIITPLYNNDIYIEETIKSVLSQTYQHWEMIIIDDHSTDCSLNIALMYSKMDKRIKVFKNEKNLGTCVTRNIAIEKANGRYIAFLDSDDTWDSVKLEKQLRFMVDNNFYFTYTDYNVIDSEGELLNISRFAPNKITYKSMLWQNRIGCLTVIYDANVIGKVYNINNRMIVDDYAMWLRVLRRTDGFCLRENLANYRVLNNSLSSKKMSLVKKNYNVYRISEGMSLIKSCYYIVLFMVIYLTKKGRR